MCLVARVVHARDHLRHAVLLARELADDQVVLVVAGQRSDHFWRPRDPGALEDVDLGRVTEQHLVLELVLEPLEAVAALLDQRHLALAVLQQHANEVRADLAAARHEDVHQAGASAGRISQARTASSRTSIATDVGQIVRRPRRR